MLKYLLLILMLCNINVKAQVVSWSNILGTAAFNDEANFISETNDGHILVCGFKSNTESFEGFYDSIVYDLYFNPIDTLTVFGTITETRKEAFAVKADLEGNPIKENEYGGNKDDYAIKIVPYNNGYLTAANSNSEDILTPNGGFDIIFYLLDQNFDLSQEWRIGGVYNDYISDFVLLDDTLYFTGDSEGYFNGTDSLGKQDLIFGYLDLLSGDHEIFSYGGNSEDVGKKLFVKDGSVYIIGDTKSTDGDISFNNGARDTWLLKIDKSQGQIIQEKCFGGSAGESGVDFVFTAYNEILLLSETASNNGDISYVYGSGDYWLAMIDANFNIQWEQTYGGSNVDIPQSIFINENEEVFMSGGTFSTDGTISNNVALLDVWIAQIDANDGSIVWDHTVGGNDYDLCHDMIKLSNGNIALAGYTDSQGITAERNIHTLHDFWFASINTMVSDINSAVENNLFKTIILNERIIIDNQSEKDLNLNIINISGQVISSLQLNGFSNREFKFESFGKGIYYIFEADLKIYHKFIIK